MSILGLSRDSWELILCKIDTKDVLRLFWVGNKVLTAILKPVIRDFDFCFATSNSPRLSRLLTAINECSVRPKSFSISLAPHYERLEFVKETDTVERWRSLFPQSLEALSLLLDCAEYPFCTLIANLARIAPNLTTFRSHFLPLVISLPHSLKKLEFGDSSIPHFVETDVVVPLVVETFPLTLTHLKIHRHLRVISKIEASELPFKKMPLTVFQAHINFRSLSDQEAQWSILPNTIVDLDAHFTYGNDEGISFPPPNLGWSTLLPSLTSLCIPTECLAAESMYENCDDALGEQISEKQIEKLSSFFPMSLTSLKTFSKDLPFLTYSVPPVVRAIGPRLRTLSYHNCFLNSAALEAVPFWENPQVFLLAKKMDFAQRRITLAEDENFENFAKNKKHPISLLYRNATSLRTALLSASAIPFLPRTLTSLKFEVVEKDSISLESASKVDSQLSSLNNRMEIDQTLQIKPFWSLLEWPKALTDLNLHFAFQNTILHLGCLPATLKVLKLDIVFPITIEEGGDLAHMSELSAFSVFGPSANSAPIIHSLYGFPKSLISITAFETPISHDVFENVAFQNFFCNLKTLFLQSASYSADVLLYLPSTLTSLTVKTRSDGAELSEKHFESINRAPLVYLGLFGGAKWPQELSFNVLSRYLPKNLATLQLQLDDLLDKDLEDKIAPHIPLTLFSFICLSPKLEDLVAERKLQMSSSEQVRKD